MRDELEPCKGDILSVVPPALAGAPPTQNFVLGFHLSALRACIRLFPYSRPAFHALSFSFEREALRHYEIPLCETGLTELPILI